MGNNIIINSSLKSLIDARNMDVHWLHICATANVPPTFDGSFNHLLWQIVGRNSPTHMVVAPFDKMALELSETSNVPICYFQKRNRGDLPLFIKLLRKIHRFLRLKALRLPVEPNLNIALQRMFLRFENARVLLWGDVGFIPMIRSIAPQRYLAFALRHYGVSTDEAHYELCDSVVMQTRGQVRNAFVSLDRVTPFVVVIPNGVELDLFTPATKELKHSTRIALSLPLSKLVVIIPGKLAPHKGASYLLEILKRAATELPLVHFLIVGDLHHSLSSRLQADLSSGLIRVNNATWVRGVARREMSRYYSASDACFMPCLCREGFSLAAIEALASGLPVLAPSAGCYSEIIQTGYNGITFPQEDIIAGGLKSIKILATNNVLLDCMSNNARKYAEMRLSREKCLHNFDAFFNGDYQQIDENLMLV